jgi:hypothetical protein
MKVGLAVGVFPVLVKDCPPGDLFLHALPMMKIDTVAARTDPFNNL